MEQDDFQSFCVNESDEEEYEATTRKRSAPSNKEDRASPKKAKRGETKSKLSIPNKINC